MTDAISGHDNRAPDVQSHPKRSRRAHIFRPTRNATAMQEKRCNSIPKCFG